MMHWFVTVASAIKMRKYSVGIGLVSAAYFGTIAVLNNYNVHIVDKDNKNMHNEEY